MSSFRFSRMYTGPVKACVLDWSGTTIDKYVLAPAMAFVEVFKKFKVPVTMEEARKPMGLRKDVHIWEVACMPSVRQRWHDVYGRDPTQEDALAMYQEFIPLQLAVLDQYAGVLPGAAETVAQLRRDAGIKFGMTTGFSRAMVDVVLVEAKKQGLELDANVAGDEALNGARPKPFMLYRNLDLMDVHPIQAVVKVDDTVCGIEEAQNAGCWGVGVARYGNYMNIDSLEHEQRLSERDINERLQISRDTLRKAGAHYVIDSLEELPEVVEDINARLAAEEKP